jgi:hypothetical protein
MSGHQRSQFGCWSCRARKKKCDETVPKCSSCELRGITCYGYGPRPEWMDAGVNQQKIVQEFQALIKENLRKRRKDRPRATYRIVSGPVSNTVPQTTSLSTTPSSTHSSSSQSSFSPYEPYIPNIDEVSSSLLSSSSGRSPREVEATLLMQYLDYVFPRQFNCYTPPITALGRGWLLALLTSTKPLYHAALSLSTFTMHAVMLKTRQKSYIKGYLEEMKRHHALSYKELQAQIAEMNESETRCLKDSIQAVACILQLISFEV